MKSIIGVVLLLVLCAFIANASVYEGTNADDVRLFLKNNPDENGALMFYDPFQEQLDPQVVRDVEKVIGIFLNIGEEGRSTESWVNSLNDKAHLMRVDALNPYTQDAVKDFHCTETPFLVLLDKGNVIFEEVVGKGTYDHVKDILNKPKPASKPAAPVAPTPPAQVP